jgi:Bacteriophage HK97-gp10, putative tail-component
MAEDVRVEVHGGRELERGTRKLADRIDEEAPKRLRKVGDDVARTVAGEVPRRSGALASSVSVSLIDEGTEVSIGSESVPYAGWIEFGGTHGRPYMSRGRYLYPTALDVDAQLVSAGEDAAEDEIGRFRWDTPNL